MSFASRGNHVALMLASEINRLNAYCYEQGPIRPPSEGKSLLIRATRNCPWNRCLFCGTYSGRKFELRKVEEVKKDIDAAKALADGIKEISWKLGYGGATRQVAAMIYNSPQSNISLRSIALWVYFNDNTAFLQDANSLIMRTHELVEVLRYLKEKFPQVQRITSYARSKTAAKKTVDELKELRQAGLDRLHIGLESGDDGVLEYMHKGVTAREHIEGGRKVKEAGISLSEYVMPGLGGRNMWQQHVKETAKVLNEIDPDFIRLRSLVVRRNTGLRTKYEEGDFEPRSEDEVVDEIAELVDRLDCNSYLVSDQMSNLLGSIEGTLPQDKDRMLASISGYRSLDPFAKLKARLETRTGAFISVYGTLEPLEEEVDEAFEAIKCESWDAAEKVEKIIFKLKDGFI